MSSKTNSAVESVKLVQIGRSSMLHVEGLNPIGSYGENAGNDTGKGYVSYAPYTACPALSRALGSFTSVRAISDTIDTPIADRPGYVKRTRVARTFTISEALAYATSVRLPVCTRCRKAAGI